MGLITIGQLKNTMLAISRFMDGTGNISRVVIIQNHYMIVGGKLNLRRNVRKLTALRRKIVYCQSQSREMEIAFAKKLVEIRNREVDKGTNSRQSKS